MRYTQLTREERIFSRKQDISNKRSLRCFNVTNRPSAVNSDETRDSEVTVPNRPMIALWPGALRKRGLASTTKSGKVLRHSSVRNGALSNHESA